MAAGQNNRRLLNFQSTNIGRGPSAILLLLLLLALCSERYFYPRTVAIIVAAGFLSRNLNQGPLSVF